MQGVNRSIQVSQLDEIYHIKKTYDPDDEFKDCNELRRLAMIVKDLEKLEFYDDPDYEKIAM